MLLNFIRQFLSQGRRNEFPIRGATEYWKVISATMVDWQEKFLNSRRSRIVNTVAFWPWSQSFDSFCFETLVFSVFAFLSPTHTQKSIAGRIGEEGGGGGAWPNPHYLYFARSVHEQHYLRSSINISTY